MCQIYFTSDLHFSHHNIAKFCPQFRPHTNVDEMNEALIAYWNATVQSEDIVYNLGDISFARDVPAIAKVMRRLNGQHHLIFGNHDNVIILRKLVGTTKIIVPVDVEVSLSVNSLYGDLTFFEQPKRALRNEQLHQETRDYLKSPKSVKILLTTMVGDVEVVRG